MTHPLRRIALVLAVTIVAVLGVNASSASAKAPLELAIQDDAVFVTQEYANLKHPVAFPLLKELKVTWIRVNVSWSAVMPRSQAKAKTKPANVRYDFSSYDTLINAARNNGMKLEVSLTTPAPAWGSGNKKIGPYKPKAALFREFVEAAVSHFGTNVSRYSAGNEFNHIGWLAPLKSQAALYRQLYPIVYDTVKRINPNAEVCFGETAPYASRRGVATPPLKFIRDVTKGRQFKADCYAHHPYDFNHKPTFKYPGKDNVTLSGLSKLTKLLNSLAASNRLETPGGQPLDLLLTEFGYLRSGRQKQTEKNRAKYIRQAYDIALKNPRVKQMLHFLLAQPAKKYRFFDTSITSQKGGKTATFKALAKWASDNASSVATTR
jgi:hypothetical protein